MELPLLLPPPYRLIVAAPPWRASGPAGLDARELGLLPMARFADPDALLVLWTPSSQPSAGLQVLEAWGFEYDRMWIWVKPGRTRAEPALVGVRGDPFKHQRKGAKPRDVFFGRPAATGGRPDQVQKALDRMFPRGNRLELFAQRQRPGWTCLGPSPTGVWDDLVRLAPTDARQGVLPMGPMGPSPWRRARQTALEFVNSEGGGGCT